MTDKIYAIMLKKDGNHEPERCDYFYNLKDATDRLFEFAKIDFEDSFDHPLTDEARKKIFEIATKKGFYNPNTDEWKVSIEELCGEDMELHDIICNCDPNFTYWDCNIIIDTNSISLYEQLYYNDNSSIDCVIKRGDQAYYYDCKELYIEEMDESILKEEEEEE